MHLDKRNSYNKYFAKPNKFDKKKEIFIRHVGVKKQIGSEN